MVDEDRLFREYLVENGIDITGMGIVSRDRNSDAEKGDNKEDKPTREAVDVVVPVDEK
jgi:hypothetical protein